MLENDMFLFVSPGSVGCWFINILSYHSHTALALLFCARKRVMREFGVVDRWAVVFQNRRDPLRFPQRVLDNNVK